MERIPATAADLHALPEHTVGEIIAGELHLSPRPAVRHIVAATRLGGELLGPFDRGNEGPGGWILLDKPELHLGKDVLVADLAGWRKDRMAEPPRTAFTLAPDWVCEVTSSSTAALDRAFKLPVYAREGVQHVWLVDPERQILEVFQLHQGRYMLLATHVGMTRVRAEPFEVLELELTYLWGKK
jgi:Uma2 family endonuclease